MDEIEDGETIQMQGALLDVDYINKGDESVIRMAIKSSDGKTYEMFDPEFRPYFYLLPHGKDVDPSSVFVLDNGKIIKPLKIEQENRALFGKNVDVTKVIVSNASYVPKLSDAMERLGSTYESDIPFAKRYVVDKSFVPLVLHSIAAKRKEGKWIVESMKRIDGSFNMEFNLLCFDIEVYSPTGAMPRVQKDPIIMLSYLFKGRDGKEFKKVITYKKIDLPFVEVVADEKEIVKRFVEIMKELDVDIVTGYNSSGFDVKYLLERSAAIGIDFNLSRFSGSTRIERHGLVDRVKIAGIVHVDMYVVVKFIAVVGAAESILKLNSKTLKNVYEAIAGEKKFAVEKGDIFKLWDGSKEDLETLATYNMADSDALYKVYQTFMPIMMELSRLTYDPLTDVCVSTTGQLVEFMLMHSAQHANELIPNKPSDGESKIRLSNPIEGAYVKTPEPGIYENLAMFDFRGLYPSIIISYNIDPSTVCTTCTDYFESPDGTKFNKSKDGITPLLLKMLMDQRVEVKKAYKKSPDNIMLGSKSMALKIVSNSFYGYLGYARSRWYSRACAASVTAYGRQYIKNCMDVAEEKGMKVIYGDTDSVVVLLGDKSRDYAKTFMKDFNAKLPKSMELELEDFYSRGVFVGKRAADKGAGSGAKKKYALISDSGRIKIRGFELVRRDWSRIARETQRMVLETILKEGDPKKAADIVKDAIKNLREGKVPLSDLVISTQLRKGLDGYDIASPEVAAARKAVNSGAKTKEQVEGGVIGYIITKHGSSISDRAELEGIAKDYDPEYYINKQVIPATMKIIKELGFTEEELKGLGMQKKLGG